MGLQATLCMMESGGSKCLCETTDARTRAAVWRWWLGAYRNHNKAQCRGGMACEQEDTENEWVRMVSRPD